jgi:hypothetical protein
MACTDLSAAATLDLWQAAEGLTPVDRSLALAAAVDERPVDELAKLPLGNRDARLLELYRSLGARMLEATAPCPACGEPAEFAFEAGALLSRGGNALQPEPVEAGGYVVGWRPPDSRDVAAASAAKDVASAERVLLLRCVTSVRGPDGDVEPSAFPAELREKVARAMADADPLAEVLVDVVCPACESAFVADLDVGGFVWAEVRTHAVRLLRDVDVLARAYGWTESEVLALDERRRAAYLDLAREAVG